MSILEFREIIEFEFYQIAYFHNPFQREGKHEFRGLKRHDMKLPCWGWDELRLTNCFSPKQEVRKNALPAQTVGCTGPQRQRITCVLHRSVFTAWIFFYWVMYDRKQYFVIDLLSCNILGKLLHHLSSSLDRRLHSTIPSWLIFGILLC